MNNFNFCNGCTPFLRTKVAQGFRRRKANKNLSPFLN